MKNYLATAAIFFIFSTTSHGASLDEICVLRAQTIKTMAQQREKGYSKAQVKTQIRNIYKKHLNTDLPPSFDLYLEAVYENRRFSPEELSIIALKTCLAEG